MVKGRGPVARRRTARRKGGVRGDKKALKNQAKKVSPCKRTSRKAKSREDGVYQIGPRCSTAQPVAGPKKEGKKNDTVGLKNVRVIWASAEQVVSSLTDYMGGKNHEIQRASGISKVTAFNWQGKKKKKK